jgi:hypothetical protein
MAYKTTIQYQDLDGRNVSYDLIFRLKIKQLLDIVNNEELMKKMQNFSPNSSTKDMMYILKSFVDMSIGFPVHNDNGFTGFQPMTEDEKKYFFESDGWDILFIELTSSEGAMMNFMRSVMPNRAVLEKIMSKDEDHSKALDAVFGQIQESDSKAYNPFQK